MFSASPMTSARCMSLVAKFKIPERAMQACCSHKRIQNRLTMRDTVFRPSSTLCRQVLLSPRTATLYRSNPRACRLTTSISSGAVSPKSSKTESTSARQLWNVFKYSAIPMLGFGFMDNTIMIQAGNFIDCTIGVWFGLPTLAAAACGQIVSAGASVMFGNALEQAAKAVGVLPSAKDMPSPQMSGRLGKRVSLAGSLVGVILGATLGLINLYWIDTKQSTQLKLEALTTKQEFEFEVQVSNSERKDATTIRVRGPDVDGVLASLTAAMTSHGYSLVELHAHPRSANTSLRDGLLGGDDHIMEDVFVIRPRIEGSGAKQPQLQVKDDDLENLGKIVLEACKDPLSAHSLKQQVNSLQDVNSKLFARLLVLENAVEQHQIEIVPSDPAEDDQNA